MFSYNTTDQETLVLSVQEVAVRLQISESMTYQLLRNGIIKGFKIGSVWKIPSESLHQFIKLQCKM